MCIHHLGSDHGDNDLVAADDAALGGFGEGELVRDGVVDFRRVHRIDEPGVAFAVAVEHVIMAGRGGEEEALADGQVLVGEGEAEVDACAARGLVRFVEEREVEGVAALHPSGDDVRGLVGVEDELHAREGRGEEGGDLRAVGGDRKIQVARAQDDFVAAGFHAGVGTDAERGEGGPRKRRQACFNSRIRRHRVLRSGFIRHRAVGARRGVPGSTLVPTVG